MSGSNIFDPRTTRAGRDNPRFCAGIKQSFSSGVSIMIYDTDTRTLLDGIKGDWWCEYVSGHVPQPTCCSKRSEMGEPKPEYVSRPIRPDSVTVSLLCWVITVRQCHYLDTTHSNIGRISVPVLSQRFLPESSPMGLLPIVMMMIY